MVRRERTADEGETRRAIVVFSTINLKTSGVYYMLKKRILNPRGTYSWDSQ